MVNPFFNKFPAWKTELHYKLGIIPYLQTVAGTSFAFSNSYESDTTRQIKFKNCNKNFFQFIFKFYALFFAYEIFHLTFKIKTLE